MLFGYSDVNISVTFVDGNWHTRATLWHGECCKVGHSPPKILVGWGTISGITEQLGALGHSLALGPLTPLPSGSLTVDGCWQAWAGIVFQCDNRTQDKNNRHKDEKKKTRKSNYITTKHLTKLQKRHNNMQTSTAESKVSNNIMK